MSQDAAEPIFNGDIHWSTKRALVLSSLIYKHVEKKLKKCQSFESIDWTAISDQVLKSNTKTHHYPATPENCRRQFHLLVRQFVGDSYSADPITAINKIINGLAARKCQEYQTSVGSQAVELRLNEPRTVTRQSTCGTISSSLVIGTEESSVGTSNHTRIAGTHTSLELPEIVDLDYTAKVQPVSVNVTMNTVPLDYSKKRSKMKIFSVSKSKPQGNVDAVQQLLQEKKVNLSPESQPVQLEVQREKDVMNCRLGSTRTNKEESDFHSTPLCGKNCRIGCNCSKVFLAHWAVAKFANKALIDPYQFTDEVGIDEPNYYPQGKATNRITFKSGSSCEQKPAPRGRLLREKSRRKQEITLKSMEEDTKDFILEQPVTSPTSSVKSALMPQQSPLERNGSAGTGLKLSGSSRYTPLPPFGWRFHSDERLEGSLFSDLHKAQKIDNTINSHILQNAGNFKTSRQTRSSTTDHVFVLSSPPKNKGSVKHYDNIVSSHRARKKFCAASSNQTMKQTPQAQATKKVSILTPNLELLEVTSTKSHVVHTTNNKNLECEEALVKTRGEQLSLNQSIDNITMSEEAIESEYVGGNGNEDVEDVPRKLLLFHSNDDLAMLVEKEGLLQADCAGGEQLKLQGEGSSLFPRSIDSQGESSSLLELEESKREKELNRRVGSSGETITDSSEVFHLEIEASSEVLGVDDDDDSSPPYEPLSDPEEDVATWVSGNKDQNQDTCITGPETNLTDVGDLLSEASVTPVPGVPQEFNSQDNDYDYLGAPPLTSMVAKKFLEDEIAASEGFGNFTEADRKIMPSLIAIASHERIEESGGTGILHEENDAQRNSNEESIKTSETIIEGLDTAATLDSTIIIDTADEKFVEAETAKDVDNCSKKSDDTEICTVNTQESEHQQESTTDSAKIAVVAVDDDNTFSPTTCDTVTCVTDKTSTAANEGSSESTKAANQETQDSRDSKCVESNQDINSKCDHETDSETVEGDCIATASGTKIDDAPPTTDQTSGDLPRPQTPDTDEGLTSEETKAEVMQATGNEGESGKACSKTVIEGLTSNDITISDPNVAKDETIELSIQDNNNDGVTTNAVQLNSQVTVTNDGDNEGLVNTGGHSRAIPESPNNNDVTDLDSLLLECGCDNTLDEEVKVSQSELMELLKEIIRACPKSLLIVQDMVSKRNDVINNIINFSTLKQRIISGQLEKLDTLEKNLRLIFFILTLQLPDTDPVHKEASLKLKFTETVFKNYREKILERSVNNSFLNDSTASTVERSANNSFLNDSTASTVEVERSVNNSFLNDSTASTVIISGDDPDQLQGDTHDDEVVIVCEKKHQVYMRGDLRGYNARRRKRARDLSPDITALTSQSSTGAPLKKRKKQLGKKRSPIQPKVVQEPREKNPSTTDCEQPCTSSSVNKSPKPETCATATSENMSGELDRNETEMALEGHSDNSNDSLTSTHKEVKRGRFTSKNLS